MQSMLQNFPISKFVNDSPLYYIAESQTLNLNNSANSKQNLKMFLVVYQDPRKSCSIKENGGGKSRETVPLNLWYINAVGENK
jgi:hypothetical protein